MKFRVIIPVGLCLVVLAVNACSSLIPTPEPQDSDEYLNNALDWIQTHAIFGTQLNWDVLRRQALVRANNADTAADTYPAIEYAIERLHDTNAFLSQPGAAAPDDYIGMTFHGPGNIVIYVEPNSPAERAGVRVGDIVVSTYENSAENQVQFTLYRIGEPNRINVMLNKTAPPPYAYEPNPSGRRIPANNTWVGYIELTPTSGFPVTYPGKVQQIMHKLDKASVCGWIIDVRRNDWGDIWSYLAGLGPILGEGNVGGFMYPDKFQEPWTYRNGKVYWATDERYESLVEGGIYTPKQEMPPVVFLTSWNTSAASELLLVAFKGREKVRIIGELTHGMPTLILQTALSDGANIYVSGAFATDRNGNVYRRSIIPDEIVVTDWRQFGTDQDPAILAAADWLNSQPECMK